MSESYRLPSEEENRKWKPRFYGFSGKKVEPPTERDIELVKREQRKRENREIDRIAKQEIRRLQIMRQLEEEGLTDIKKSDAEIQVDVNAVVRKILSARR